MLYAEVDWMTESDFRYDFFISYERSASREFAERLLARLTTAHGARVFLDADLSPGVDWEATIRRAIGESRRFVVVLAQEQTRSTYVKSELQVAVELEESDGRRKIMWVDTGDDCPNPAELPLGLQKYNGVVAARVGGVDGTAEWLARDLHDPGTDPPQSGLTLFASREDATPRMLQDTEHASRAYFFGVSNRRLSRYLQQVADNASKRTLPLKHVEVYFANNELGELLDPVEFSSHMRDAILRVSVVLKSHPAFADPHVSFYQVPHALGRIGSRFMLTRDERHEDLPFSVFYNVVIERGLDLSLAWTMSLRYSKCNSLERRIFRLESSSFERLKESREHLVTAGSGNVWDGSGRAWDRFQQDYPVYKEICRHLWEFGDVDSSHRVLDFGSGTGTSLRTLAPRLKRGSLTLIDASPGMLRIARKGIASDRNVAIVLGDASSELPGIHSSECFDRITSCLSLQAFTDDLGSINRFAANCKRYLADDGRVIVGVHNSFMSCDNPSGFESWTDPLRAAIQEELSNRCVAMRQSPMAQRKFNQSEIVSEFERVGLRFEECRSVQIARSMDDRVAMWRTPAVFDSIVDLSLINAQIHDDIVTAAGKRVRKEETMPTTVCMMCFRH